jgi:hypothetical protein
MVKGRAAFGNTGKVGTLSVHQYRELEGLTMISDHCFWFAWSLLFLALLGMVFAIFRDVCRKVEEAGLSTA